VRSLSRSDTINLVHSGSLFSYVYQATLGNQLFAEAMATKKATAKNRAALEALSYLMTRGHLHTTTFHANQFPRQHNPKPRYR